MTRVLIIDDHVKAKIKALIEKAASEPYSLEELCKLSEGFNPVDPNTRPDKRIHEKFTIDLPIGYTVTYTHECQPVGLCRHLSVSITKEGKTPCPEAVNEIMGLFGFKAPLLESFSYLEHYKIGFAAVNVIEVI